MANSNWQHTKPLSHNGYCKLNVNVDLSTIGLSTAWSESFRKTHIEPDILFVCIEDYHLAEKIISHLPFSMKLLNVIMRDDFKYGEWCVGHLMTPDSFVGSSSA